MFGWFRPTCPCDLAAKQWIESRLQWLTRQFGLHILLERPIILPTPEFFPDPWDGSENSVRFMFRRVCGYMGVDPEDLNLEFFDDHRGGGLNAMGIPTAVAAATWSGGEGPWQKGVVRLERNTLDRPMDLVGAMAHELSHQRLLGEGRLNSDAFDNELLTDLTAVFHGMGVFLANNPRKHVGELSRWPGTNLVMPEYMSEPLFGYALAHVAWIRDEDHPAWAKHLRWVPRGTFKQGLRYLQKFADSSFKPVRIG